MMSVLLPASLLWQGLAPPEIERPRPSIFQRGATARIELRGKRLEDAQRVVCDGAAGVTAKIIARKTNTLTLDVSVAANAAVSDRELRVVTAAGVSNSRPVAVSLLPVLVENGATASGVPEIELPAILSGSIDAATEVDRFRFHATAGQSLIFDVQAARIGSRLDPVVTLFAPGGRPVAWGAPQPNGDSLLEFETADAGEYLLEVRDLRYRGGPAFHYRMRCGEIPYLVSVFPLAGRRGSKCHLQLEGRNLWTRSVEVDLDEARPGRQPLLLVGERAASNALVFEVSDRDETLEREPNDSHDAAQAVAVGGAVSARIDRPGDVDVFRFEVKTKDTLLLETQAKEFGSPLDALLELHDDQGRRLQVDDDSARPDARIRRELAPGIYRASVRDVRGAGGPRHAYRLRIVPATAPQPDFTLRFRPDTPRVSRGSHTRIWCEIVRHGGFRGEVRLAARELPQGVSVSPLVLGPHNAWTSVCTLDAAEDAPLGSFAAVLEARARLDGTLVERQGIPEAGSRSVIRAHVTVLDRPAFVVTPLGPPPPVAARYVDELARLEEQLAAPPVQVAREQLAWERRIVTDPTWVVLDPLEVSARLGSSFRRLDDGSILAKGKAPATDTYRLVARTRLASIGALRLEVLPHASLPHDGPGRHVNNGNFVLNRIALTVGRRAAILQQPTARFSQPGYEVERAIDGNPDTGWAVVPQTGRANWAVFSLREPIASAGEAVTVELEQTYGLTHLIGRFRLSVAKGRVAPEQPAVPADVFAICRSKSRTADQETRLAEHYLEVSPTLAAIRARIAEIERGAANQPEIDALREVLARSTPELDAAQARWEARVLPGLVKWTPLTFQEMKSERGVRFEKEPQSVVRVVRPVGPKDNYTLVAPTEVRGITAIRLEALPGKELPGGGPGLAPNGNFVLTDISLSTWPAADPTQAAPVPLVKPQASFEQPGFPIARTLDGSHPTGWAVLGNTGKPSYAIWRVKKPLVHDSDLVLRVYLEHQSGNANHLLGRFRMSVTSQDNPGLGAGDMPVDVVQILVTPHAARSAEQKQRLAQYYRSIAPELRAVRERVTRLRTEQSAFPPRVARGGKGLLAVRVRRRAGFDREVRVSLEGFSSGRGRDRRPNPITKDIRVEAVTVKPEQEIALLELQPSAKCPLGMRSVVIRAEAAGAVEQYSAPLPLTVTAAVKPLTAPR